MNNFCWKSLPIRIFGAMFVMAATTTAAQANQTELTGFETYGDQMAGMQVTVNFLDGTSQTAFWTPLGRHFGGALGVNWSLTQAGDTYDDPWAFNYFGSSRVSYLDIIAVTGNTVFDLYRGVEYTRRSADGTTFTVISGQAPDSYGYSGAIDIKGWSGDLFGRLAMSWNNGFWGEMRFKADTDSGKRNAPARTKEPLPPPPPPPNVPPTLDFPNYVIYEGQAAWATLSANDPNPHPVTFVLNGQAYTDYNTSGVRSGYFYLGSHADQGVIGLAGQAVDSQGAVSSVVDRTLTILNVAPTLTTFALNGINSDITIFEGESVAATLTSTDPGLYDDHSYWINGVYYGTDPTDTLGPKAIGTSLGTFYDDTVATYTAVARDELEGSNLLTRTVTVKNIAPTLTAFDLLTDTLDQGQTAFANLFATDPGTDPITFRINNTLNDIVVATDPTLSGTRSLLGANLGIFNTPGTYTFRAQAQDDDLGFSQIIEKTLTVRNLAPSITALTAPLKVLENQLFDIIANATDGIDLLTYEWDLDNDGQYDLTGPGSTMQASFQKSGVHTIGLRVADAYGGYSYRSIDVTVEHVPEPSSALSLLAFGAMGAGSLLLTKRKP